MAKQTPVPAGNGGREPCSGVAITYTPELLANMRYRYEETDETITSIAADFGVPRTTFRRLANDNGWVRRRSLARDLSPAAKLLAQAQKLKKEDRKNDARDDAEGITDLSPVEAAKLEPEPLNSTDAAGAEEDSGQALPPFGDSILRLHAAVLEELAAVEGMRARLKREPQKPTDAERTARTLSTLTETLQKLRRLQSELQGNETDNDDDMPADIDEFRGELARRIREFVASRTARGDAAGPAAPPLDPVQ
jgi:hypothetical protein